MKCSYSFDEDRNLVNVKYAGELSVDEVIAFQHQVAADPRFHVGMNTLTDLSEAVFNWSLGDLDRYRAHISKVKDIIGDSRWALVAAQGVTHATTRMFAVLHEALRDTLSVRQFDNEADALHWLNSDKH